MIQSLDHIAITISKEENLSFYEKLGFSEIKRNYREGKDTIVFMKGYNIVLEVFVGENHIYNKEVLPYGLRHLAFVVDNIEETLRKLEVTEYDEIKSFGTSRFTFFKDPDGTSIELQEKNGESEW